jgi:hypothetical protein
VGPNDHFRFKSGYITQPTPRPTHLDREDGRSMFLRNVATHLYD